MIRVGASPKTFEPCAMAAPIPLSLSGGVVVLHCAGTLVGHGISDCEISQAVAVRVAPFGEQAKKLVVCGDHLQNHDATGRPLCGVGFGDGPRVRGYHRLSDLKIVERSRDL